MNFAPTYLVSRFFHRVVDFLYHWYVKSMRLYWHKVIERLERMDYYLAWKITAKNLFRPLYKDYSIVGYIMGFFLRTGRLIVASIIYVIFLSLALLVYIMWLLIIPAIIYKILNPLF